MKLYDIKPQSSAISFAGLLEKIEIMRARLRWAQRMERAEIQKLLLQCNALRDDVMQLSHKERFVQASTGQKAEPPATEKQRRQALLDRSFVFEGVFGENPKLLESLETAEKAAPTDLPVLIDGESGTGKELMAKVIHANGDRTDMPYISVNCGAIPENLLESELFGHKKGAFTGATGDRKGKFESADKGTIFLDEIGELPLTSQVKLLRVLQSNEIQRIGSDALIEVDARVVAATNKNLRKLSQEGKFREDLFYRLSVIHVTVPPLRERRDELALLIEFFTDEAAEKLRRAPIRMSARLHGFLLRYGYPGNIRELRNIIYRLTCLSGDTADLDNLPEDIRPESGVSAAIVTSEISPDASLVEVKKAASDEAEKQYLESGLRETSGKVTELAQRIEMNRSHLQTLLKKHGLRSKDFKPNRQA
ncbi:MAG: sigma-54 dependent transcriptional regulator [Pseudomonadota bacterium]|nr:sigma-54 dependent transcriptional regulator [Pseudomonadota bacterium]